MILLQEFFIKISGKSLKRFKIILLDLPLENSNHYEEYNDGSLSARKQYCST